VLGRGTLLDGAMGTALLTRGLPAGALPEEWILSRPEVLAEVHAEHARAGARVILTCTFNLAAPRLEERLDPARIEALCERASRLARGAAGGGLVAGALGPTGLFGPGRPTPDPAEVRARYERPARALAETGVDLLWIETQWDLEEARLAIAAARAAGLPAAVTFALRDAGGALVAPDGRRAEALLSAVEAEGAVAAGVNCVAPGPALTALSGWARGALRVPLVAKPSPGLPGAVLAPDAFAAALRPAIAAGLEAVGGCCGATGAHLTALRAVLLEPRAPRPRSEEAI
jgi:5-methyltetrahydrofolate--homocysteine methyltransferase